jgi:hypothetical protein
MRLGMFARNELPTVFSLSQLFLLKHKTPRKLELVLLAFFYSFPTLTIIVLKVLALTGSSNLFVGLFCTLIAVHPATKHQILTVRRFPF